MSDPGQHQREIYGHTAVYLVRDCGIYLEKSPDVTVHWLSHDVEINLLQSNLDVVTGVVSELLADHDFSRACYLGSFIDTTQVVDTRLDPAAEQGYYYLVSGDHSCTAIGYGNSSIGPRDVGAVASDTTARVFRKYQVLERLGTPTGRL